MIKFYSVGIRWSKYEWAALVGCDSESRLRYGAKFSRLTRSCLICSYLRSSQYIPLNSILILSSHNGGNMFFQNAVKFCQTTRQRDSHNILAVKVRCQTNLHKFKTIGTAKISSKRITDYCKLLCHTFRSKWVISRHLIKIWKHIKRGNWVVLRILSLVWDLTSM